MSYITCSGSKIRTSNTLYFIDKIKIVEISKKPIALFKILKFEGLAASGGEVKSAISEGRVLVNEEIETRKRKKIVSGGDVVSFYGLSIRIQLK